jgi:hypothetical protein
MAFTIDVFEDPLSDTGKVLSIDNRVLQYHDLEMYIHEIAGFMYGTLTQYFEQANAHEAYSTFTIVDTSGDAINISIKSSWETQAEDQRVSNEISTALWKYFGNKLVNDMMRAIHAGVEVRVGGITAHRGGIRFENTNSFGAATQCNIPWEVVGGMYRNGSLMIYSFTDKDCFHWLDLRTVLHAHTLGGVIRMIMTDPTLMLILKGQRMPFPYYPPNN